VLAIAAAAFYGFRVLTGGDGASSAAQLPTTSSTTSSTTTTASPSTTATATATMSAENAAAQKALQECVTRQDAAKAVVTAASTGAQHWSEHVQGQADIDSGAKTYIEVKQNVFAPTRAAGPNDVAAYEGATASYAAVSGCQSVASMQASSDLTPKLKACAAREQALEAYMSAAQAVMTDWKTHLSEMADHTDGHLNGPDAQARWIERYKAAPAHLDPYKAAAAALDAAPACSS